MYYKTGNMIAPYFTQYICYAAAILVILAVGYKCGKESFRFTAYFEFVALSINIFRQAGKIGYFIVSNQHISKSIYGWVVLFAGLMILTALMLKKSKGLPEAA